MALKDESFRPTFALSFEDSDSGDTDWQHVGSHDFGVPGPSSSVTAEDSRSCTQVRSSHIQATMASVSVNQRQNWQKAPKDIIVDQTSVRSTQLESNNGTDSAQSVQCEREVKDPGSTSVQKPHHVRVGYLREAAQQLKNKIISHNNNNKKPKPASYGHSSGSYVQVQTSSGPQFVYRLHPAVSAVAGDRLTGSAGSRNIGARRLSLQDVARAKSFPVPGSSGGSSKGKATGMEVSLVRRHSLNPAPSSPQLTR